MTLKYSRTAARTIKYFSAESHEPLTLGILIETSGSQQRVLDIEQEASTQFLHDVLNLKTSRF